MEIIGRVMIMSTIAADSKKDCRRKRFVRQLGKDLSSVPNRERRANARQQVVRLEDARRLPASENERVFRTTRG